MVRSSIYYKKTEIPVFTAGETKNGRSKVNALIMMITVHFLVQAKRVWIKINNNLHTSFFQNKHLCVAHLYLHIIDKPEF